MVGALECTESREKRIAYLEAFEDGKQRMIYAQWYAREGKEKEVPLLLEYRCGITITLCCTSTTWRKIT